MIPPSQLTFTQLDQRLLAHSQKAKHNFTKYSNNIYADCYELANRCVAKYHEMVPVEVRQDFKVFLAEEIFIVLKSGRQIEHWRAYLEVSLRRYIDDYMRLIAKPTLYSDAPKLRYNNQMFRRYFSLEVETAQDKKDTAEALSQLFNKASAFFRRGGAGYGRWTSRAASKNAHISFLLSIKHGRFVPFRLKNKDARIVRMLYNQIHESVKEILHNAEQGKLTDEQYLKLLGQEIYEMNLLTIEEED